MRINKPWIIGTSGAIGLLIVYLAILSWANSPAHAVEQLSRMWLWISLLVIGFGIQLGLFSYIRIGARKKVAGATAEVATAGGISAGSMVACCAHHVTDVLPLMGLSAAAVFLGQYQLPFIHLGILSNLVGISIMSSIIQAHDLYPREGIMNRVFKYNMKTVRNVVVVSAVVLVGASFLWVALRSTGPGPGTVARNAAPPAPAKTPDQPEKMQTPAVDTLDLPARVNDENRVSISIKPTSLDPGEPANFKVSINTHEGALDFDLTEISLLEDDKGNVYEPVGWEGSPPGGHHRSGILTFPKLTSGVKSIRLIIRDVYGVPERVFEWNLP